MRGGATTDRLLHELACAAVVSPARWLTRFRLRCSESFPVTTLYRQLAGADLVPHWQSWPFRRLALAAGGSGFVVEHRVAG